MYIYIYMWICASVHACEIIFWTVANKTKQIEMLSNKPNTYRCIV